MKKQPVLSHLLHKFYQIVHQTVFPPKCLVCANFFHPPDDPGGAISGGCHDPVNLLASSLRAYADRVMARYLCPHCIKGLVEITSPLCTCCGMPFKSRQGQDHHCGECLTSPKQFRIARAPLVYEPIMTEIIHCFKYRGKIQLAQPLGELLLTAFMFFWDKDSIDVIMPVPLHPKRLRNRGFNQVYLLIRNWSTIAASRFCDPPRLRIERDILIRKVPTEPQTALGRTDRAVNIKNAFELKGEEKITDKRILLIDDVYTTGATASECARLLLNRGAQQVDVLTLARAV
jgi:ComF family protein